MRTDLDSTFITEAAKVRTTPRQLLVFHFDEAGDVYVSDQALGVADGLAHEYLPLVEDWGELRDTSGNDYGSESAEIRQMTLTLINTGSTPFSDYFLAEYPENVEVELSQCFLTESGAELADIETFYIQDPIQFDEINGLLKIDLVSTGIELNRRVGSKLTTDDWPYAHTDDIGKSIPLLYGSPGKIPALYAKAPVELTLDGSILTNATRIPVHEDIDSSGLPSVGTVQIDEELIRYSGWDEDGLVVVQRGYLSEADQHLHDAAVIQYITDHTFVLCEGPVYSIDDVRIDDVVVDSSMYTAYPALNPARIVFSTTPRVEKYSGGTRFLEMNFDDVGAANTALQAPYAFDTERVATAATISATATTLSLIQSSDAIDYGQIKNVYLSVAHWCKGTIAGDYVTVWVSGVGEVGRLSRPNPDDIVALTADIDIDHGHDHSTGTQHYHNYSNPAFASTSPSHGHSLAITTSEIRTNIGSFPINTWIEKSGPNWTIDYISFPEYDNNNGVWLDYSLDWYLTATYTAPVIDFVININSTTHVIPLTGTSGTIYIAAGAHGTNPYIRYRAETTGAICKFNLVSCALIWHAINSVGSQAATVNTSLSASGNVAGQSQDSANAPIKAVDDVHDLTTGNRPLNINDQDNPSRTITDLYEITDNVNFDWDWFTGREVRLVYHNTGDNKAVKVMHMFFEVEFHPRETVISHDVTANVIKAAGVDDPADAIYALLVDKGAVPTSAIDATAFADCSSYYAANSYHLDGLIDADLSVREAIKKICVQTRSRLWRNAGQYKLALKKSVDATPIKEFTPAEIELRSMAIERQPVTDLANKINVYFSRDWCSDADGTSAYLQSTTQSRQSMIDKFGLLENDFEFDLIGNTDMAADVALQYIEELAQPSTFYTFDTWLNNFALEKEDPILVSYAWNKMNKVPMLIRQVHRLFGSGKNKQANLLRIVAENLYYILKKYTLAESIQIFDALDFYFYVGININDAIQVVDEFLATVNVLREDEALIADTLTALLDMHKTLTESISATDAVAGNMHMVINDTVGVSEIAKMWSVYGYGAGGYGVIPYGGARIWERLFVETSVVTDSLYIDGAPV